MNAENDWLDQMRSSANEARSVANALASLADSFEETGNQCVADRLLKLSERLRLVHETINSAASGKISDDFHDSQRMAFSMLEGIAAGVIRAPEKSA